MRLKRYCEAITTVKGVSLTCNKHLILTHKHELTDGTLLFYKCGHFFYKPHLNKIATFDVKSCDGKLELFPYQVEGVQFLLDNDGNGLIGDQMGLGKTMQALMTLKANKSYIPCLIPVKNSTLYQWADAIKTWYSNLPLSVWIIRNGKDFIPPGFDIYLISMDTLSKFVTWKIKKGNRIIELDPPRINSMIKDINFKCVVADEVHSFKNTDSNRTQALVELVSQLNIEHKIFLSGTPIKNRADEYFIPLNLLDPESFPSLKAFQNRWLVKDDKGKYSRVSPYYYDAFKDKISEYVIRRERNEVLKDLPPFRRTHTALQLEDGDLIEQYNKECEKLQQISDAKSHLTWFDVQEKLMVLRRIVGVAKARYADTLVEEFLNETDDEKMCIGIHHTSVRDLLFHKLRPFAPITLSGEDSAEMKYEKLKEFQKPHRRIMIVNMLAGGVGLNIQFCNNALIVERQWSSADEEQFEDRFNRPGQILPVTAEYLVLKGTIDEYFHDLVQKKRFIFGETIANSWDITNDSNSLREMIEWTISNKVK